MCATKIASTSSPAHATLYINLSSPYQIYAEHIYRKSMHSQRLATLIGKRSPITSCAGQHKIRNFAFVSLELESLFRAYIDQSILRTYCETIRSVLVARLNRKYLCHWTMRMSNHTQNKKIPIYVSYRTYVLSINRCIVSDASHSYSGSRLVRQTRQLPHQHIDAIQRSRFTFTSFWDHTSPCCMMLLVLFTLTPCVSTGRKKEKKKKNKLHDSWIWLCESAISFLHSKNSILANISDEILMPFEQYLDGSGRWPVQKFI